MTTPAPPAEAHPVKEEPELSERNFKYLTTVAKETIKALGDVIANSDWQSPEELIKLLKEKGKQLMEPEPWQTTIDNVVKRVLKITRHECSRIFYEKPEEDIQEALEKLVICEGTEDFKKLQCSLKESVEGSLRELVTEIDTGSDNIATQLFEHVQLNDVVMTMGRSRTVEKSLLKGISKRKFEVVVAEAYPCCNGHLLAKNLAEGGIETTIIFDEAIYALMSRVNKVIIGTHTVMANGGLKAMCGIHILTHCAKRFNVPVIVCAPYFKLSTEYFRSLDQEGFSYMMNPDEICSYEDAMGGEVVNPAFDYIPPEHVNLLVSHASGNSPSYVYRLLRELYHPDDENT